MNFEQTKPICNGSDIRTTPVIGEAITVRVHHLSQRIGTLGNCNGNVNAHHGVSGVNTNNEQLLFDEFQKLKQF
jgi:hypothetical protein